MKLSILAGSTSQTINIFIQNSASTTGAGLTGLAYNTASLTAYYTGVKSASSAISLATLAAITTAYTSGGFKEVDATNMPGWYRLDLPDAAISSGRFVNIHLQGATNMAPCPIEIELTAWNNQDGVHGGLSAIPNATAGASNGLLISGTNSGTTTFGAVTCTGTFTISDGLAISRSSSNATAITATGNGTGNGATFTSGSGATGNGLSAIANSTNGTAFSLTGAGTGSALSATAGATGHGIKVIAGGTSGNGINITTTSGDGISVTPTAGTALVLTGNGTSKHGAIITGGTAGTSDGIKAVAGTGGVDIRGAITGNLTGTVDIAKINGSATAASNLSTAAGTMITSTAITGTLSTTQMSTSLSSTTTDLYKNRIVVFTSGTLTAQVGKISAYDGSTQIITFDSALAGTPSNGDAFIVV